MRSARHAAPRQCRGRCDKHAPGRPGSRRRDQACRPRSRAVRGPPPRAGSPDRPVIAMCRCPSTRAWRKSPVRARVRRGYPPPLSHPVQWSADYSSHRQAVRRGDWGASMVLFAARVLHETSEGSPAEGVIISYASTEMSFWSMLSGRHLSFQRVGNCSFEHHLLSFGPCRLPCCRSQVGAGGGQVWFPQRAFGGRLLVAQGTGGAEEQRGTLGFSPGGCGASQPFQALRADQLVAQLPAQGEGFLVQSPGSLMVPTREGRPRQVIQGVYETSPGAPIPVQPRRFFVERRRLLVVAFEQVLVAQIGQAGGMLLRVS